MLIDEHGEKEPKHQSARDEQNAEHQDVPSGGDEALGCEQAFELLQADEVEDRQHFRTAKGKSYSPDHRADIDGDNDDGGGKKSEGGGGVPAPPRARPRAAGCADRLGHGCFPRRLSFGGSHHAAADPTVLLRRLNCGGKLGDEIVGCLTRGIEILRDDVV